MRKFSIKISLMLLPLLLTAGMCFGQQKASPPQKPPQPSKVSSMPHKNLKPPKGKGFYIDNVGEDRSTFSMLLSDDNSRTVAGTFRLAQIEIFEALMIEAKKFAETDEAAGAPGNPKTTRFVDKDEKALIVDVQKTGLESRFFLTLETLQGTLTVDMGAIKRGNKKDSPMFYSILNRLQAAKDPAAPPK